MIAKCNPLNIRFSSRNNWRGQQGETKGFANFISMDYGYRAALVLLFNYHKAGHNTVRKIISRWAPPSENDTASYIQFVSSNAGVFPDEEIKFRMQMARICAAMSQMETGTRPYVEHIYDLIVQEKLVF